MNLYEERLLMLSEEIVDIAVVDCTDSLTIQSFSPASEASLERDVNHNNST